MAQNFLRNLPEQTKEVQSMMLDIQGKLKDGYDRLITFRVPSGGYEWFGQSPANEALSAYGLLEFTDME